MKGAQFSGSKKDYNSFLKKKGVDDLAGKSDEEKKDFFNKVDRNWVSDDEDKKDDTDSNDIQYEENTMEDLRVFIAENDFDEISEEERSELRDFITTGQSN
jgi:hypothetical protein